MPNPCKTTPTITDEMKNRPLFARIKQVALKCFSLSIRTLWRCVCIQRACQTAQWKGNPENPVDCSRAEVKTGTAKSDTSNPCQNKLTPSEMICKLFVRLRSRVAQW